MKALAFRLILIISILNCSSKLLGHVALDYPVGGETYIQGQTVTIQWHIVAFHQQLNWDLYFSSDGGDNWQPIQLDIPVDSLSYTWLVPAVVTSQGRIKIFQDNVEHDYLDVSGDFSIVPNTSPPSLDAPADDAIIECSAGNQEAALQNWLNNHGGAAATNYCGDLIWTNDYDGLSDDCGMTGSALVTFTATDGCGTTFTVATISIVDSSPPIITTMPLNKIVECDGQGNSIDFNNWLNNHGGAQTSDACSNVTWTTNYSPLSNGCGATGSTTVLFFATDACGNSISSTASFTIVDHLAPVISQPAHDTILECGVNTSQAIQAWLNNHGSAQANDVCGNVSWMNNFSELSDLCGSTGSATVQFTVKDDCGNSATTSATILIQDHTAPVISTIAQDTTMICGTPNLPDVIQSWLNRHAGALASDACGDVNWSNDFSSAGDTCNTEVRLINFIATDDCGNSSMSQAFLTLLDTTPPTIDTTIFAPIGSAWYYVAPSFGPPWMVVPLYFQFLTEKDTFMLGYHARIIGCYVNVEGQLERRNDLTKYVATVGQKVFYKVGDDFVLLFDFGAQGGDTIHSKVEPFELNLGCSSPDTIIDFSYVIDSIKVQQFDGGDLLAQYVTSIDQFPGPNWGFGFLDDAPIYERIGYFGLGGFWWGVGGDGCILETGNLRCYVDDQIIWKSSGFNSSLACDYLYSTEVEQEQSNFIFPNPSFGKFTLPGHARLLSVFSLEGKEANYTQSENEIDLSGNPAGLYIVRFEIGKQTYFSKLVLN